MTPSPASHLPASSHLMEFILGLLTPMLMAGTINDPALARLAAIEAVAAYPAAGQHQLINVGQVISFALTAIDNLRLSMPADLSLSMKLKLRGNANALNRAARDHSRNLQDPGQTMAERATIARLRTEQPAAETIAPAEPEPAEPEPAPQTAPSKSGRQDRLIWASAMKRAATELKNATNVPPGEQAANRLWIQSLTGVANKLCDPTTPFPATTTDGMRAALMASGASFPADIRSAAKPPGYRQPK